MYFVEHTNFIFCDNANNFYSIEVKPCLSKNSQYTKKFLFRYEKIIFKRVLKASGLFIYACYF